MSFKGMMNGHKKKLYSIRQNECLYIFLDGF